MVATSSLIALWARQRYERETEPESGYDWEGVISDPEEEKRIRNYDPEQAARLRFSKINQLRSKGLSD